ncbi:MAG: aldo/keto reductase [Bacteroidales bacterium]|jgi:predicted oxidoreductase|nr:aldo/keto reductase [Bacteroidales bacterium]
MMNERNLIYGCMGLGGSWNKNSLTNEDQKKADNIIETALYAGITHFDHADIYNFGKAEQAFGNYLKRNQSLREKLFIQSKTGIIINGGSLGSSIYNLSQNYISNQVDQILKRLSTDYLDALLLHRPDPLTAMEDIAATIHLLKKSGKVKTFGVSNMSTAQIQLLQSYLEEPLISNQIELNLSQSMLLDLEVWVNRVESPKEVGLGGLLAYSQEHNLSLQAYSPLVKGRYSNEGVKDEKDKITLKLIEELAEKYKSSISGILLAWLWRIPANIQPVIGTTNLKRIQESAAALNVNLSREDWYALWINAKGKKLP